MNRGSGDSEEEKAYDSLVDDYRKRRRPSAEELCAVTLRSTFSSLPTPFGGHSPRLNTLRTTANFSIVGSYGSMSADVSPSDAAMETPQPFLKNSSLTTGLNLTVHLLGIGLMALPWAFSIIGWAAVLLVVFLGIAHSWGAVLLIRCGRVMHFTSSYQELSDTAFGIRGRTLLFSLSVAQQFLDQVIYLHLFAVTLASINSWPRLSNARGHAQWLIVATVFSIASNVTISCAPVLCGLAFADVSRVLAVVGALASITLTTLLVGDLGSQVLELLPLSSTVVPDELLRGPWSLFRAFGSVCYCFAGQAALPSLVSSMKQPQQAEAVVFCTHGFLICAYLVIGVFGLVLQTTLGTYGDAYLYWFQENSGLVWWDVGLKACIITVLCTKSVLALQPLVDSVVDALRPRFDAWILPRPSSSPPPPDVTPSMSALLLQVHSGRLELIKWRRCVKVSLRLALRVAAPAAVLLLGLFLRPLDNLVSLINLAGCVSVIVTVIVPCLLALELLKDELGCVETFCAWILVSSASTAAGLCVFFYCWG